jgi:hypothetical protein
MNVTNLPSREIAGSTLNQLAWAPFRPTLTRIVVEDRRSRTKMSISPLVSPATRFAADEANATKRPSPESAAPTVAPSSTAPLVLRETSRVAPPRSWTNAWYRPFAPGANPTAEETNPRRVPAWDSWRSK